MALLLGKEYHKDDESLSIAWQNFFWITYRHDFVPIAGTSFTGDAGWGCMIRCGQMLAASALASTLSGYRWLHESRMDHVIRKHIISYFLDNPHAPLSTHRIVAEGERRGRRPGEWHAPSITAHCITQLINQNLNIGLRSHCARDMIIDRSELINLLDGSKLLLWLPLRLGVEQVNGRYIPLLREILRLPQCVGLAGGRPNSALYFVGYDVDGYLLYLDPHYSRPSIEEGALTEEQMLSYTCETMNRLSIDNMDPCFVAGFVISDPIELDQWLTALVGLCGDTDDAQGGGDLIGVIYDSKPANTIVDREEEDVIDIDFAD